MRIGNSINKFRNSPSMDSNEFSPISMHFSFLQICKYVPHILDISSIFMQNINNLLHKICTFDFHQDIFGRIIAKKNCYQLNFPFGLILIWDAI